MMYGCRNFSERRDGCMDLIPSLQQERLESILDD